MHSVVFQITSDILWSWIKQSCVILLQHFTIFLKISDTNVSGSCTCMTGERTDAVDSMAHEISSELLYTQPQINLPTILIQECFPSYRRRTWDSRDNLFKTSVLKWYNRDSFPALSEWAVLRIFFPWWLGGGMGVWGRDVNADGERRKGKHYFATLSVMDQLADKTQF